jgi:hypothetical protein
MPTGSTVLILPSDYPVKDYAEGRGYWVPYAPVPAQNELDETGPKGAKDVWFALIATSCIKNFLRSWSPTSPVEFNNKLDEIQYGKCRMHVFDLEEYPQGLRVAWSPAPFPDGSRKGKVIKFSGPNSELCRYTFTDPETSESCKIPCIAASTWAPVDNPVTVSPTDKILGAGTAGGNIPGDHDEGLR